MECNKKEDIIRPKTKEDPMGRGARKFKMALRKYIDMKSKK